MIAIQHLDPDTKKVGYISMNFLVGSKFVVKPRPTLSEEHGLRSPHTICVFTSIEDARRFIDDIPYRTAKNCSPVSLIPEPPRNEG